MRRGFGMVAIRCVCVAVVLFGASASTSTSCSDSSADGECSPPLTSALLQAKMDKQNEEANTGEHQEQEEEEEAEAEVEAEVEAWPGWEPDDRVPAKDPKTGKIVEDRDKCVTKYRDTWVPDPYCCARESRCKNDYIQSKGKKDCLVLHPFHMMHRTVCSPPAEGYIPPTPGPTRAVSCTWRVTHANKYCAFESTERAEKTVKFSPDPHHRQVTSSVSECQTLVAADAACSLTMWTNGDGGTCSCLRPGEACPIEKSERGNSVYECVEGKDATTGSGPDPRPDPRPAATTESPRATGQGSDTASKPDPTPSPTSAPRQTTTDGECGSSKTNAKIKDHRFCKQSCDDTGKCNRRRKINKCANSCTDACACATVDA